MSPISARIAGARLHADAARVAFLLGPSLSRILRDLEARRLIERKVAKADLRRGVVSISASLVSFLLS